MTAPDPTLLAPFGNRQTAGTNCVCTHIKRDEKRSVCVSFIHRVNLLLNDTIVSET